MGWSALLVAAGGFLGAIARYWLSKKIGERFQSGAPYGTLSVNLAGSFLLGFVLGSVTSHTVLLLAGTGFMGALTTFSTFKLEIVKLASTSRWPALTAYIIASYGLGLALAYAGFRMGQLL